jgi:hypothetical protein
VGPGANSAERENVALYSRLSVVESDRLGRFVSRQMPSDPKFHIGIVVSHPDYAARWLPIFLPEGLQTNWIVVLTQGLALPGRVISTNGEAIAGASVLVREPHGGPEMSAKTDDQGSFTLTQLPPGIAQLEVRAAGFRYLDRNVPVESNATRVVLELQPAAATAGSITERLPTRFSGTVVDAESGEPVPRFKVVVDDHRDGHSSLLGEGRDGKFDWRLSLGFNTNCTFEVNAEGYEPQASLFREPGDADQTFEFHLKQGGSLRGQVIQPNGQPAAGAAIGLDTDDSGLKFQPPAKFENYGHPVNQARTDAKGLFFLKSMIGMTGIPGRTCPAR